MTVHTEQPMPIPNDRPSIQSLVRADLDAREQVGIQRYGTALQPHNGRDAMRDLYEELLDGACYIKQAMVERGDQQAVEVATCVAHGKPGCQQCHLTRPGGLDADGNCTGCETYAETGLHWDTCPNRAFEVYYGNDRSGYKSPAEVSTLIDRAVQEARAMMVAAVNAAAPAPQRVKPTVCACHRWANVNGFSAAQWYGQEHHPNCDGSGQQKATP